MATRYTTGIYTQSDTTAHIRAWAGEIEALLTASGWVQTSDTGQTAAASLPACVSAYTSAGYQVWRMNDALQSSYPVYMLLMYGCSGAITSVSLGVTIGSGSNGTGGITGILLPYFWMGSGSGNAGSTSAPFYGSGSTNRLCFQLGGMNYLYTNILLSIERTKDIYGADTGTGIMVLQNTPAGASPSVPIFASRVCRFLDNTLLPSTMIGAYGPSGTTWGGPSNTVGVCPVRYHSGGPSNPGINLMAYLNADISAGVSVPVPIYGTTHTYMPLGSAMLSPSVNTNATSSLMMLWE